MQCYAEKQAMGEVSQELLDTQVNPAVWEISGHIVLKRRNDYEEASETSAWKLLAEVSLSEERFEEVKAYIFSAAGLVQSDEQEKVGEHTTTYVPVSVASLPVTEGCLVLQ
jgi:GDP-L-galactose phosphorylase